MNKKIFAAIMFIFVIAAFFIPWIWIIQTYGMENIPHYDLTMWIFEAVFGILILLLFIGISLIVLSFPEVPEPEELTEEPVEDGSYIEISELLEAQYNYELLEEPAEETVETPVEELTEEEAPEELQTEEAVEHPAEWDEEKFE